MSVSDSSPRLYSRHPSDPLPSARRVSSAHRRKQEEVEKAVTPTVRATRRAQRATIFRVPSFVSKETALEFVGPYTIRRTHSRGKYWRYKLGYHHSTGNMVGIRVLRKLDLEHHLDMRVRLEREIHALRLASPHPHVLRLFDVLQSRHYVFVVTEHVDGFTLLDFVRREDRSASYARQALLFFRQVLEALHFLHHDVHLCHRDIKLEHIYVEEATQTIRLTNFTSAACISPLATTTTTTRSKGSGTVVGETDHDNNALLHVRCGSKHYACPEILSGEPYDGVAADMWSCGVVLYALLCFTLPFEANEDETLYERIRSVDYPEPTHLPPSLRAWLRAFLTRDPVRRLRSGEALKSTFLQIAVEEADVFYDAQEQ